MATRRKPPPLHRQGCCASPKRDLSALPVIVMALDDDALRRLPSPSDSQSSRAAMPGTAGGSAAHGMAAGTGPMLVHPRHDFRGNVGVHHGQQRCGVRREGVRPVRGRWCDDGRGGRRPWLWWRRWRVLVWRTLVAGSRSRSPGRDLQLGPHDVTGRIDGDRQAMVPAERGHREPKRQP